MANTDPKSRFVLDPREIIKPEDNPSVAELRALVNRQASSETCLD